MRSQIDAIVKSAGLVPAQMTAIDNACPTDATTAGVSSTEASKEKLEWRSMLYTYIRKCRLGGATPSRGWLSTLLAAVRPRGPGRSRRFRGFPTSRWKDVFELTEWFRPGTLKKDANFDPNKM